MKFFLIIFETGEEEGKLKDFSVFFLSFLHFLPPFLTSFIHADGLPSFLPSCGLADVVIPCQGTEYTHVGSNFQGTFPTLVQLSLSTTCSVLVLPDMSDYRSNNQNEGSVRQAKSLRGTGVNTVHN